MANRFKIIEYLSKEGIPYQTIQHRPLLTSADINQFRTDKKAAIARAVLLRDSDGLLMAILPAGAMLDHPELCRLMSRDLEPVPSDEISKYFQPSPHNYVPPLPKVYGMAAIIDTSISGCEKLFIESGENDSFLELAGKDFLTLLGDVWQGNFATASEDMIAMPSEILPEQDPVTVVSSFTTKRLKQRVQEAYELPIMPDIARQLLELRIDPDASAVDLAEIVEMDPSLSAQVVSWARSPYYGYSGTVQSVEHAIIRVLGYDLVMNLAVGLAIGKSINVPQEGPLGLNNYWQAAINCAALMDKLARYVDLPEKPVQGLAYLSGLLFNFGHLILGHVFPRQFNQLNTIITLNPLYSVLQLEYHVFGVAHNDIATWLLKSWNLPDEVVSSVQYHDENCYDKDHFVYANLCLLASRLLKRTGIGFSPTKEIPKDVLKRLNISESNAITALEEVIAEQCVLRTLSRQMAGA